MVINAAQLHLILNHLPVIGLMWSVGLLLVAMLSRSRDIKVVALGSTVIAGLLAIPAFKSGEGSEEFLEGLEGSQAAEAWVEEHEDAAKFALGFSLVLAAGAAGALLLRNRGDVFFDRSVRGVFLGAVFVLTILGKTAHEGGKIRHPEIRNGEAPPSHSDEGVGADDDS